MTSCRTYSPYGAWELKRTYQRNLLLANLCVLTLVLAAVGIPSILFSHSVIVAPLDGEEDADTVLIVTTLDEPPVIIRDPTGGPHTQALEELVAGIPIPIDDSLFPETDLPAIASRSDLADYYLGGVDDGTGGEGTDGGAGYDPNAVYAPDTPDIDDFVPVDIAPAMIHSAKPDYPRHARQAGLEGTVYVAALIGIDGKVKDARVRKSSGIEAFDQAALEAAWKNRYSPAIRAGQPVLIWVTYKVEFRLND